MSLRFDIEVSEPVFGRAEISLHVVDNEFKFTVAHPTTGGPNVTGEVAWKRIH
jgi:hypothetical protein